MKYVFKTITVRGNDELDMAMNEAASLGFTEVVAITVYDQTGAFCSAFKETKVIMRKRDE